MSIYQNGKIYKITCDETKLIYYGSTCKTLTERLSAHKCPVKEGNSKCATTKMINMKIELVENYPCESKKELLRREGYYIKNNECCNEKIAGRTMKEYRKDNRVRILKYKKDYHEKNYEKEKEYRLAYNKRENVKERMKGYNEKYYYDNLEYHKERGAKYREANREKLLKKITCECGSIHSYENRHGHYKTKKHINFINSK